MAISGTKLRENIYRVLDQVIETGEPVEIMRKGHLLRIVPDSKGGVRRLPKRPTMRCAPHELLGIDWSSEWKP